jgi:hypothetical protein
MIWPERRTSLLAVSTALATMALSGCAQQPSEPLPPPPAINLYMCAAPAGMTAPERQPLRPVGDYTQDDVALYITDLHHWATRGWLKLARVREHADKCVASTEEDED